MVSPDFHDVAIVGGGPAGLSAARLLGQHVRKVLLLDSGDGEPEAALPDNAIRLRTNVDDVARCAIGFSIHCSDGNRHTSRALLLASDLMNFLPPVEGAGSFFGRTLHQCPYCDGWEHKGRKLGVLGSCEASTDLALKLLKWSASVTLFAHGGTLDPACLKRLEKRKIPVVTGKIRALEGTEGNLDGARLDSGSLHTCEAMFFSAPRKYHSSLSARLGCDLERISDAVLWRPDGESEIEGLFSAERSDKVRHASPIAASEGLKAAEAVNDWLLAADQSYLKPAPDPRPNRPVTFRRRLPHQPS